jgi:hypothetical protein
LPTCWQAVPRGQKNLPTLQKHKKLSLRLGVSAVKVFDIDLDER